MYQFATRWTDEIAAVSEQFQNATVSLLDPSLLLASTTLPQASGRTQETRC